MSSFPDAAADPGGLDRLARLRAGGLRIDSVTHDSRQVAPGAMYACLRGDHFDGHDFVGDAVAAGAVAVLVDHEIPESVAGDTAQIVVDDTRRRLGPIAAEVAGHPSRQLSTVGITGTNGKTTTAHLIAAIFDANGWTTGIVGTLHGPRTTPEAPELQSLLARFVDDGAAAAVLEVSSHALAMHRVDGTEFDAVVFTNLGHDHLDLHGTAEEYFRAKASLFTPEFAPFGVINVDDPHGRLLADTALVSSEDRGFRIVPYSLDEITDLEIGATEHRYRWRGIDVMVAIGGRFNVANSLAALTTAVELGIDPEVAVAGLRNVRPVPGRFEVVHAGDRHHEFTVVVDYAHTPDGLAEVLDAARSVAGAGRSVIVVFGCGGERDRDKRPEMGAVAARSADRVVVTSDNPRHEDPEAIIGHIVAGVDERYRDRVMTMPDRRAAIQESITMATSGDVIVVAGKGHELTQDLGDRIVDFDDRAVVRELLEDLT